MKTHHRGAMLATLVAAALGLAAGIAYATIPGAGGVIHGCYKKSGGTLRVIDDSVESCGSNETPLDWNARGVLEIEPDSLTGAEIDEATLGQVPSATLGGIGRSASGGSCNPSGLAFFTCAVTSVDLPVRTRVLAIATVKAYPFAGVRAPGSCRLATSTNTVLAAYSFEGATDIDPTLVPLVGITDAGPGRVDFGIECNDPAAPEFDAAYGGASVAVVALSPS